MSRVAVIGRGLWGAAAARHLAQAGAQVTLIGPPEPEGKRTHNGVFASHWDEGRITRKNALDPYWVGVSTAAIDRYAEIEAQSGIRFYTETGALMAGGEGFMAKVHKGRMQHDVPCALLDQDALNAKFPFFRFPQGHTGAFEPDRAGHVSPRRLVALLPPIRYPDGKLYLKLGGDPEDVPLVGSDAIRDWFHLGGNIQVRDHLHAMVMDLMPDLQVERVTMDACVTTWTKDRRPEIQWLSDRVAICAGGNGAGAKCSDEMGRLGAAMVQQRTGENARAKSDLSALA